MARASVWAFGAALHYKGLSDEEQADLFNLYSASRSTDGDEMKSVLKVSLLETVQEAMSAFMESRKGGVEAPLSNPPLAPARCDKKTAPQQLRPSKNPDILKPRLSAEQLVNEA